MVLVLGQAIDRFWTSVTAPTAIAIVLAPITEMARAWIFWDWFRMAGTLAAYLCFVKAAAEPEIHGACGPYTFTPAPSGPGLSA
jgi:hypothetical protein